MRERPEISGRYAWYAVAVIVLVTVLNYAYRYVVSPLLPPIRDVFGVSDAALGSLATAFVVVYAVTAVPFGRLSDLWVRKYVIAIGMAGCALATMGSAFSPSFRFLFATRSLVGIGEALCLPSALAIVSDYVGARHRARATALIAGGMLAGGALGIAGGGALREALDWRTIFWLTGMPGIGVALLALTLREPPKGRTETVEGAERAATPPMRTLLQVPTFWTVCGGIALLTAATGGLLHWLPMFMEQVHGWSASRASLAGGGATMAGCLAGAITSGLWADALAARVRAGLVALIGSGILLSVPAMLFFLSAEGSAVSLPYLVLGGFFLTWPLAPMGALLYALIEPKLRGAAVALFTFIIHVAGDAASPLLIGGLSDMYQARGVAEPDNLRLALLALPACAFVGAIICFAALRTAEGDMEAMQRRLAEQTRIGHIQPTRGGT